MPDLDRTPKTTEQLRAIFGLGRPLGMAKEDLEELAFDLTGGRTARLSLLTFPEANGMIVRLGGDPFPAPGHVAKRTEAWRNQKAGVKRIESNRQLRLIADLAAKRGMSEAALAGLCKRIIKRSSPATTAQGNKIVEALKAMIAREQNAAKEAA
ncbi:MAG: hypothetical protein R2682_01875 [Pyrinomonadaceae bacterium]